MCGICGIIGNVENKEQILQGMMKAIRHRGPDGGESYVAKEAALGFQRLSIIDLDTGMQPMFNEEGNKALVFNGEIYNYWILKDMLVQKGHIFQTTSDSEILLHGYEEFGEGMLLKLRGMFGFAIWDEDRKELFAARDFFGIKPFYYAVVGGTFVFASEIKSILEYPGYRRQINEEALEQYLSFQYSVLPETFFKGIYKLLPGHYLTFKNHVLQVVRYFEASLKPERHESMKHALKDVENIMRQSVRRHMISDVEVGSFLSGGVDSGLIAAISGCVRTFTVGFCGEGTLYDETEDARELADTLRLKNNCRYIEKEEFERAIPEVMYYLDEPSGDASAVALYFLAQEASKEVKVVLSGEGSDEIFGGYNIYREPKMLRLIDWLPLSFRKKLACMAQKLPKSMKGRGYLIRAAIPVSERYIGNAYIFHEEEKMRLLKQEVKKQAKEVIQGTYEDASHLKDAEQMQSVDLKYWLPGDILQKADRMSMAHSLELRVPYLDWDVFRIARGLPCRMKLHRRTTKYILRRAARAYLPKPASSKPKLGFPVPIRNWLKEEDWYENIKAAFGGETASDYFHTDYLMELLEEHKKGAADNSRKIWTVYVFLVWYHIFFESQGNIDYNRHRESSVRGQMI
ncbi:asparagine synthase (glutamine-hydrolyzing) [Lachnospiraceae bacterium MD308]|nr:asparagine synthase (glutamine-hydrolyzing) [Lachnospiraceae bacterium MD308]